MIGSYKNRHSSGDPSAEGPSGSGGTSKLASEMQLQVQNQQEELERLRKDLSSQKVILLPHISISSHISRPGTRGAKPGFHVSLTPLFPRRCFSPKSCMLPRPLT